MDTKARALAMVSAPELSAERFLKISRTTVVITPPSKKNFIFRLCRKMCGQRSNSSLGSLASAIRTSALLFSNFDATSPCSHGVQSL